MMLLDVLWYKYQMSIFHHTFKLKDERQDFPYQWQLISGNNGRLASFVYVP